jgi:hypothetical protein
LPDAGVSSPAVLGGAEAAFLLFENGALAQVGAEQGSASVLFDPGRGPRISGPATAFVTRSGTVLVDARTGDLIAIDPQEVAALPGQPAGTDAESGLRPGATTGRRSG